MTTTTQPKADKDIIVELKAQLRETEKLHAVQAKELETLRPTRDIRPRLFATVDDVRTFFGAKKIAELVNTRIAAEQKRLNRQGYDRLVYTEAQREELTEALLQSMVDDREMTSPPESGWLTRTLKMTAPDGSLRQIIYEGQVNNVAGSLADGLLVYERKGFKRVDPFLCPSQNCWLEAALTTSGRGKGKWVYKGYCSEDHFTRTERGAKPVPGTDS